MMRLPGFATFKFQRVASGHKRALLLPALASDRALGQDGWRVRDDLAHGQLVLALETGLGLHVAAGEIARLRDPIAQAEILLRIGAMHLVDTARLSEADLDDLDGFGYREARYCPQAVGWLIRFALAPSSAA